MSIEVVIQSMDFTIDIRLCETIEFVSVSQWSERSEAELSVD